MTQNAEINSPRIPSLYRYAYMISGFLLVGIGVLGIFLPLLPTTIFLILASACFMKSSPRANKWLRNNKFLGEYLKNYQDKSGLSVRMKAINIFALWVSILSSVYFLTNELYIRIILFAIAVGVTIHLVLIKTKRPEKTENIKT